MLTYERALAQILKKTPRARTALVELEQALGLTLARPIVARHDLPRFDNTAVDGYAVRLEGSVKTWHVIGEAQAGRPFHDRVGRGQAVRILTGAPVPHGADAVIMQERVTRRPGRIGAEEEPKPGQHIRRRGEDLKAGTRVLAAGTILRPQELGLLAAMGYRRVPVHPRPRVAILVTGDEVRPPGSRLKAGQIYESNGMLLHAMVQQLGATPRRLGIVPDRMVPLMQRIRVGLVADILVIAGGVSVGDKDFVRLAARRCGVTPVFWQVDIKPGKPLLFGRRGRTMVFGLPGNPVSVFATFQEFVVPALCRLMGRPWDPGYRVPARLAKPVAVSPSRRTHFIRVRTVSRNGHLDVEPVAGQGSHQLRSLVQADGWIRLAAEDGPWPSGSSVLMKPARGAWPRSPREVGGW